MCAYVDDKHTLLTIEVILPGVKKENINVRMHEDSFSMSAAREDIEFVATLAFCCPVKPEAAVAKYENGLLKIEAPFKDLMEDAIKIKIQ